MTETELRDLMGRLGTDCWEEQWLAPHAREAVLTALDHLAKERVRLDWLAHHACRIEAWVSGPDRGALSLEYVNDNADLCLVRTRGAEASDALREAVDRAMQQEKTP